MIVSSENIRGQHLVETCGLSLAGRIGVIVPTAFSDSSVKLVMAFSGLVFLLVSSPRYDSSGLTIATSRPRGCSVSCYCV